MRENLFNHWMNQYLNHFRLNQPTQHSIDYINSIIDKMDDDEMVYWLHTT